MNYSVLRAKMAEHVLLVDFHLPASIAGAALDIDLNYTIHEAGERPVTARPDIALIGPSAATAPPAYMFCRWPPCRTMSST